MLSTADLFLKEGECMRLPRTLPFLTAVAIGVGCTGTASAPDIAGVRAAITGLRTAVNAADSATFFALLTDDFEVLPPGAEPLRGADARALFRGLFTESTPTLDPFTNEELQVSGDSGVQRYSFRLTVQPKAGGGATTEAGSGIHVWRRGSDGRWHLWKDIWTNPPAAAKS